MQASPLAAWPRGRPSERAKTNMAQGPYALG